MNANIMMMALNEIPRISKALKTNGADAQEDMKAIIATLKNNTEFHGEAMALVDTKSLLKAVKGKKISEDAAQTIKSSALRELSCKFNCEADFKNEQKIKLLEDLLS